MQPSDEELLNAAVEGHYESLSTLLKRCAPELRRRLTSKIGRQWQSVLDADDVLQVTYLEAFQRIGDLRSRTMTSFMAWLTTIGQHCIHDAVTALQRAKRPQPSQRIEARGGNDSTIALLDMLNAGTTTPSRNVARDEAGKALEAAMLKLPEDYAQAVRLYDLDGKSIADVCEAMGRSSGAVHMMRARAHDRLRELLGGASAFFSSTG